MWFTANALYSPRQISPCGTKKVAHISSYLILKVPHTAVAIGVTHCEVAPSHVLYAANGSLVALCCLPEKVSSRGGPVVLSQVPLCPCVGFGEWGPAGASLCAISSCPH